MAEKKGMKRLIFGECLMSPSLDGSKRFTVRRYRQGSHDFKKNEIFIGEYKDGLDILHQAIADTKIGTFRLLKLDKKYLDKKGYYFDEEYFEDLATYYENLDWDELGAVIMYEVLKVNDVPVVCFNEHVKSE